MDHNLAKRFTSVPLDARKVRTREALSEALVTLLGRSSLDEISIRDITDEAGTGYATFFRHYPAKGALLLDVASAVTRQAMDHSLPYLGQGTRASALALCSAIDGQRRVWTALLRGGATEAIRQELLGHVKQIPIALRGSTAWTPNDLRLRLGAASTVELIAWWMEAGEDVSVEKIAELLDTMVIMPTMTGSAMLSEINKETGD